MKNAQDDNDKPLVTIDYATVQDLVLFEQHYRKLTDEIQQACVQLNSSPPLADGSPRAQQRAEWRAWLELQITSKKRTRDDLIASMTASGVVVKNLPK